MRSQQRWKLVEQATLDLVLETPDVIAAAPAWALRWLSYVLNAYREIRDEPVLAIWCDRLLGSLERTAMDSERAVEIFRAISECLGGIRELPNALLDRFAKVFEGQFCASRPTMQQRLLFAAHRPVVCHPATTTLLVEFVRTQADPKLVAGVWLPIDEAGTDAFLAIAEHLVVLAPSPMPDELVSHIGRRLGALCLHTAARAWTMVAAWLRQRPASATCQRLWRPILDALADGAALRATRDLDRFAEVAVALWQAWRASDPSHRGLVAALFRAFRHAAGERRGVMSALFPIVCEVITHGDGHDIEGIDVPWPELSATELERVVTATVARIAAGSPIPDVYRWFGAAIEHLIERMAGGARLTGAQVDRLYTAVRDAPWILDHEALCVKLQTLARTARAG